MLINTVAAYLGSGIIKKLKSRVLATTKYNHGWVAKVQNRVYKRQNKLIYKRLGFTGVLWIYLRFYGSLYSLQVFLGVVFALPTATSDAIPLPIR
jgi:hypothetical protein